MEYLLMNYWSGNVESPSRTIQSLTIPPSCPWELDDKIFLNGSWGNKGINDLEASFMMVTFIGLRWTTKLLEKRTSTVCPTWKSHKLWDQPYRWDGQIYATVALLLISTLPPLIGYEAFSIGKALCWVMEKWRINSNNNLDREIIGQSKKSWLLFS